MKKIKKTISLLLTLMMLLSLGSITAIAEEGDEQGGGGAAEDISLTSSSPAGTIENSMVSIIKNENDVQILPNPNQNAYVKDNSSGTSTIVNIDANITSSYGLYEENNTSDNLKVTVAGSINSSSGSSDAVNVVNTAGTNVIEVGGSVTGADDGIDAAVTGGSTTIHVEGDVKASSGYGINNKSDLYKVLGVGTKIEGNLTVSVGGSVIGSENGDSYGIYTENHTGNTNISVTGDVNGIGGIYASNGSGNMKIEVDGDVESNATNSDAVRSVNGNTGSADKGAMTIDVGKNINGSIYTSNSGTTVIQAGGDVEGNIKAQNYSGSTTISVDGSVTGNDADGINTNSRNTSETLTVNVGVVDNKGNTVVSSSVTGGQDGIDVLNQSGSTDISVTGNVEGKSGDGVRIVNGSYTLSYSELTPEQIEKGIEEGIITQSNGKNVTVTIGGSVKGAQDGIEVWDDTGSTTVTVNGNAIGEKEAGVKLTVKNDNPSVVADGEGGSTILVGGNAEGKEAGILVEIQPASDPNQQNAIVVEGTVTGDHAIKLNVAETVNEDAVDAVIDAIPEIIVQTLAPKADMVAVIGGDRVDAEKVKQQVLDQVKYIVDTNVNTTQVDNLVIEIYKLTEDGKRAELDTESVTGKNLTVATTGTKLIVSATTGSLVGVSISTENNNNSVTYNEATGQYEITVGIGGGLKFTATPKKADNNNSDPKPDDKPEETAESKESNNSDPKPDDKPKEKTTARKENADTSATAANNNALISLDYKNHILTIDMTTTPGQIFLTDTICRFQRNGFETVVIKVANGSFTVAMDDLVQMIGTAFSFTLKVAGDTLSISAGGNEIATLVMA